MKLTLHNPPEGYEAEAKLIRPKIDEPYLGRSGTVAIATHDFDSFYVVLTPKRFDYIPRPDWLPDRLTYGWLAMNSNGSWEWYEFRPEIIKQPKLWVTNGGACTGVPPCLIPEGYLAPEDWRESLICCMPED